MSSEPYVCLGGFVIAGDCRRSSSEKSGILLVSKSVFLSRRFEDEEALEALEEVADEEGLEEVEEVAALQQLEELDELEELEELDNMDDEDGNVEID